MVTISARLASLATAPAPPDAPPPPESHGKRLVTTAPKPQAARPVDRPESTKSTGRYRLSHRGTYQRSPGTVQVAERKGQGQAPHDEDGRRQVGRAAGEVPEPLARPGQQVRQGGDGQRAAGEPPQVEIPGDVERQPPLLLPERDRIHGAASPAHARIPTGRTRWGFSSYPIRSSAGGAGLVPLAVGRLPPPGAAARAAGRHPHADHVGDLLGV